VTVRPALLPAALVVLTVGLCGCAGTDASEASASGSSSSSTGSASSAAPTTPSAEGQRIEVQVAGGRVSGDTGRVPVAAGTPVTLVVTSDVADEAHLHGYDIAAELAPGKPAELTFDATIPGVFEFELHEAGTVLLTLQVQ
jgi:plastocyanin